VLSELNVNSLSVGMQSLNFSFLLARLNQNWWVTMTWRKHTTL